MKVGWDDENALEELATGRLVAEPAVNHWKIDNGNPVLVTALANLGCSLESLVLHGSEMLQQLALQLLLLA